MWLGLQVSVVCVSRVHTCAHLSVWGCVSAWVCAHLCVSVCM